MIEGLQVTVRGEEVRDLATARAVHHEERLATYAAQIASLQAAKVEGMAYTNGDPVQALEGRRSVHENDAKEMRFIAAHVDLTETYLLDRDALQQLGIVNSRY